MGKISMIVVVGFAVIIGVVGTSMNRRTSDAQKANVSVYERTQARNVAKSATDIYKRQLLKNPNLNGTFSFAVMGGNATVVVNEKTPGNRNKLGLSTNGTYGSATRTIGLDASKPDLPPPQITGALGISYLSKAKIKLNKGANIDGNNYGLDGIANNAFPAIAGLSLGHPDQLVGLDYTPKDVKIKGKGVVEPNIEVQTPQPDYYNWAMTLAKGADVTYSSRDVKNIATLGTLANPQVTYVEGNTKFNENVSGAGILIVDGNCKFNKAFNFVGLVFAIGDSLESEKASMGKGSKLIGAMMVAGKKTSVKIGDADILYSAAAVNQMLGLVPSRMPKGYAFSNWRE